VQELLRPTAKKRTLFFALSDTLISALSLYMAYLLRFSFEIPEHELDVYVSVAPAFSLFRVSLFYLFGLYKFQWRYFAMSDQLKLFYATFASTVAMYAMSVFFSSYIFEGFARSVLALEFFISIFLLLALRVSKRAYLSAFYKNAFAPPTLLIGSVKELESVVRSLLEANEYRPIAIIDANSSGAYLHGVEVLALEQLDSERLEEATTAILTNGHSREALSELHEFLERHGIKEVKILNSLFESEVKVRDVTLEDLLARHPKDLDKDIIATFLKEKVVLVTGAGGSIGSEICRQCEAFGVKKLIALEHSEYNLYQISEEIKSVCVTPVLQSVLDKDSLEKTFQTHKPQIVIHAAAYKHVPLVEENIQEAILNNIVGTQNIVDMSIKHNVEKFVLISTDKAVRPTNVMGSTKRVCELYAQNVEAKETKIVSVRFGNVLGSSGSVIPKFKRQIESGKNITVTHPDITRYFMLISEACELVLQAGAIGEGGELFILDMGESVKIVDLAKKMIELSGRDDIKIEFTGLRKGEKLYEELLLDESESKTKYESIMVAKPTKYAIEKLRDDIEELLSGDDKVEKLRKIVPEFEHHLNEEKSF
jgi:UDP-N-acetyl-D-glucosamine 4,6-dehydratase